MGRQFDVTRLTAVLILVLATGGCAVFGAGGRGDGGEPAPTAAAADDDSTPEAPAETTTEPPAESMEALLVARDYEGVVAAFAADSALRADEDALYLAGLAAAMSGHPRHDPARAGRLFRRLLELHPDTRWRSEAELYLEMLDRERDLRATIDRLDRELRQLKAIDLGQELEESDP